MRKKNFKTLRVAFNMKNIIKTFFNLHLVRVRHLLLLDFVLYCVVYCCFESLNSECLPLNDAALEWNDKTALSR